MTPIDVLLRLQQLGVKVWLEAEQLRLSTDRSELPDDIRGAVEAHAQGIADFLKQAMTDAAPGTEPAGIEPASRETPLPVSFVQQRFWFLDQLGEDNAAYNLLFPLRLRGPLDGQRLRDALDQIVGRHEVLRTVFVEHGGEPAQRAAAPSGLELRVIDLADEPDAEAAVRERLREELGTGFDLHTGPLFRCSLLRLGSDDHVLQIAMHHIIGDRWSYGVLFAELTQLYSGGPAPAPLSIQYADFAAWQRRWYDAEGAALADWWRQTLADLPTLELPTDRPRPPLQTFRGPSQAIVYPGEDIDRLSALVQGEGATLFMGLLAVFEIVLARYSGQRDIVLGTPVGGRDRPELEPLVGPFLNTLVLRTDLSGNPSFREVLRRVRQTALDAFERQGMPFEQLVVELKPKRDPSRNPLFQVLFSLLNDAPLPRLGELDVELVFPEAGASMFDLSLLVRRDPNQLVGILEYNEDLFDDATIERMGRHILGTLHAVVADPEASVWQIPLLDAAERRELLEDRNATARDFPRDSTFSAEFAATASRNPESVAAQCGDAVLTYGELDERANRMAHALRSRGAGPGSLVGVSLPRSLDMLVALLAIQKSGAGYVPLDPTYPAERLQFIIDDAELALLVTQEDLRAQLPQRLPPVLLLDADAAEISAQPSTALPPPSADDLVYVIFTSGSTGKPKGVQIEHRALLNFLHATAHTPGLTETDVLVAVTTISFDIAGLELYLPLLCGGRVVIATEAEASDGRDLGALIERAGATVMQATPATWHLLLEAGWHGKADLRVLCGGEALPRELAERLLAAVGELWNMYGPTETTIWSLAKRVERGEGAVPIGAPLANTTVFLLDAQGQPVPVGVPGRLFLGGDGLARGYWRRPELTAEKFVDNPVHPGTRIYETGDLARYTNAGELEFLGRTDHQVKVRGYRIELGEIEHVLGRDAAVKECAVTTLDRGGGDAQLAAFVVLHPGSAATVSELRRAVREALPLYMVPQTFTMLDEMPLTPNGKIDRKALAASHSGGGAAADDHVPPSTPTERFLAELWQRVLGVEKAGLLDNFFDLGGHSLLAMKVLYEVEQQFGERMLPMELLLQNLGQFAEACDQRRGGAANTEPTEPPATGEDGRRGVLGRLRAKLGRGRR